MTAKPEIMSIRSVVVTAQRQNAQIDACASFVTIAIG